MSALIFTSIPPVRRLSIRNSNLLGNSDVTKIGKSDAVPLPPPVRHTSNPIEPCAYKNIDRPLLNPCCRMFRSVCVRDRSNRASLPFRFATLIPPWAFSLGAAGGHMYQMIAAHNFSSGNVGLVLPIDILMPIVGFVFLWLSFKHPQPGTAYSNLT